MEIPTVNETLTTPAFYVLLALVDKTLHGYGIRDVVANDSGGLVVPAPATVYLILKRHHKQGLVERIPAGEEGSITYRYRLSARGRRVLEIEAKRLYEISEHARYKLTGRLRGWSEL